MIAAHCLLRGFEVGATTVIENSDVGPCAVTGAGSAEKISMNPISAKAAPVAVSSRVEEFNIFRTKKYGSAIIIIVTRTPGIKRT
jgi:hypothetical protein